ncbi:MAG TPA: biotin/lipoyl-containing protein [Candidatus Limnocylindrales bacterium]|nr:biotin/lipoyl-containing protein [Candidatus Limnocylindrales bacterium]
MPDHATPGDRTPAQRQADHASLARLSETLVPALVAKLTGTGLGEVEVREGDWRIRVRRPLGGGSAGAARRADRPRLGVSGTHAQTPPHGPGHRGTASGVPADPHRAVATSPAVGTFRPSAAIGTKVQAGDRIGTVDLLGIPQDVSAPIDGTLVDVLIAAGEAVEYGEGIAVIEADAVVVQPADDAPAPGAEG